MATRRPSLRRERERDLVQATRALFDERGMQDAPIEEIARSVGIARGLIYRQFASKDELYVLTVTDYLAELDEALGVADDATAAPIARLEALTRAYAAFCERYPAFIDSALSLMRGPARDLRDQVSDSVWLRLGQGMATCVGHVARVLRDGQASGDFLVEDADYAANVLWTQALGVMHLARIQVGVRELAPGIPGLFPVDPEEIVESCVRLALASVVPPART